MRLLYSVLGIASVPATVILANLFWRGFREARCLGLLLGSQELLQQVVTPELLTNPPADVARFAQPVPGGYELNLRNFRQADAKAQARLRAILRVAIAVAILGSGIVGYLAVGWFGLVLPLINLFIMQSTFVGSTRSTRGSVDQAAMAQAVLNVKILAVILYRWRAKSLTDVAAWLDTEPQLKTLSEVLASNIAIPDLDPECPAYRAFLSVFEQQMELSGLTGEAYARKYVANFRGFADVHRRECPRCGAFVS